MPIQPNAYPLRIDPTIMLKVKFIATENGRSLNKEIEAILKIAVKRYEAENGLISVAE